MGRPRRRAAVVEPRSDPIRVHFIGAAGNEQTHSFSLGGFSFPLDPLMLPSVDSVEARGIASI